MLNKVLIVMLLMVGVVYVEGLFGVIDGFGFNLVIEVVDSVGIVKGQIVLDLYVDKVFKYVECLVVLVKVGNYDGVVFYCVIDGFMVQIGDVEFGKYGVDMVCVGMGGLFMFDFLVEFNDVSFQCGIVGMVCVQDFNSVNSQFFIDLVLVEFLDG